jgi:hypothetical protein
MRHEQPRKAVIDTAVPVIKPPVCQRFLFLLRGFLDTGSVGAKGRDKRLGFDRLLKAVTRLVG